MSRAGSVVGCAVLAASAFFAIGVSGCGARGSAPVAAPAPIRRASSPPPPPVLWDRFAEASAWPPVSDAWLPSAGHGPGGWQLQIRTPADAADAYRSLTPGGEFAVGTVLVAAQKDATGQPGPYFAMLKEAAGRWRFVATDPAGWLDRGADLALCARCHAEAPADQVFGLPRPDPSGSAPPP